MADFSPNTYSESPHRDYRKEEYPSPEYLDELHKLRKELKRCRKIYKNSRGFKTVPGLYKGLQECAVTLMVALISRGVKKL